MTSIKVGDIVARKSYGLDLLFKVKSIRKIDGVNECELKGICCRLMADAPENDLELVSEDRIAREVLSNKEFINR